MSEYPAAPTHEEPFRQTPESLNGSHTHGFMLPGGETLQVAPPDPELGRRAAAFFGGAAAFVLIGGVLAVFLKGYAADFMLSGLEILPFAILGALAHAGSRATWGIVVSYLWLAILLTMMVGFVIGTSLLVISASGAFGGRFDSLPASVPTYSAGNLAAVVFFTLLGIAIAGMLCMPAARTTLARTLPLDPASNVHAIALSLTAGATVMFMGQLAGAGGHPVLLDMVQITPEGNKELTPEKLLLSMLFTLAWSIPGGIVAVGYPLTRTLRESMTRLGFVRPTVRQVVGALVGSVALVAFMNYAIDPVITGTWKLFGWPPTDVEAFEKLLAPAMTPLGAVIIAVTAGVGEEMAIRGVLQPRLGILLPNLFFTSLHAMQYGFDGLLSVFIVGMILGYIRKRTNTTTSAIVHGTYDFILVMMSILLK